MNAYAQRKPEEQSRAVANSAFAKGFDSRNAAHFADASPAAVVQRRFDESMNQSSKVHSQLYFQKSLNQNPRVIAQAKLAHSLSKPCGISPEPTEWDRALAKEKLLRTLTQRTAMQRQVIPCDEGEIEQEKCSPVQKQANPKLTNRTDLPGGGPGIVQCVWPLGGLTNWLFPSKANLTEEEKKKQQKKENKEGDLIPGKMSKVSKFGDTHKPIKLKPEDEAYRWTPGGGFESLRVAEQEPVTSSQSSPVTPSTMEALESSQAVPGPFINYPMIDPGMISAKPTSSTQIETSGPRESQAWPVKDKLNYLDFSLGGTEREGSWKQTKASKAEKEAGLSYDMSLLRGTYSRETLGGSGKDKIYKVGSGESVSSQVAHAKGKGEYEVVPNLLRANIKGQQQFGALEGGYEGMLKVDYEDTSAALGLRGNLGAYAAKGSTGVGVDLRIPYTNIMLSLGVKGEAAYGYGVGAEAALKASKEKGVWAGLSGRLVSGLGVGWGASLGIGKFDPKQYWFGGKSDEAYLEDLSGKHQPDRWKGVPPDVKARLRKELRQRKKRGVA